MKAQSYRPANANKRGNAAQPVICASLLLLGLLCGDAFAQGGPAIPPGSVVAGMSQAEWSRAWWQWAYAFDRDESPVADRNGAFCDRKQDGPVWFLAGTYGTQRTVRTCKVPAGKYLFFPLINYVVVPRGDMRPTCASVTRTAAASTDEVSSLIVDIDGVRVPNLSSYRQATRSCFDAGARSEPPIARYPSAANGYYLMLRPLNRGTHTLNFGGALPDMVQAVTYTLEVD